MDSKASSQPLLRRAEGVDLPRGTFFGGCESVDLILSEAESTDLSAVLPIKPIS